MKIGIIDADIVGRNKHRFPNLACMKISAYQKSIGNEVKLLTSYNDVDMYDKVYISKVFVNTEIPGEPKDQSGKTEETVIEWYRDNEFLKKPNIEYGGTGFFYDKAPKLPYEVEHIMPDYSLYDDWVKQCIDNGAKEKEFTYYRDYSIGFLTRGCFRQCVFCVNRNCKRCETHSNIMEFYDQSRPKLCFLDDNFFSNPKWYDIIQEVKSIGKPFQFKQGLDERLLTDKHIHEIVSWKYCGDLIFAFDNIADRDIIERKLSRIFYLYPKFKRVLKFYVFCGFDRNGKYDEEFWLSDIESVFTRCFILAKYGAVPYIMRHENVYNSSYDVLYATIAGWCNQISFFKKMTFRQFAIGKGMSSKNYRIYKNCPDKYLSDGNKKGSSWRAMESFEKEYPSYAERFFNMAGDDLLQIKK